MVIKNIKEKFLELKWTSWLERPFSPFLCSCFLGGTMEEYFSKIEMSGISCKAAIYQKGSWFESQEVWDGIVRNLNNYLKNHNMFDVTSSLKKFEKESFKIIEELIISKKDPIEKLKVLYDIFSKCTAFVWLAHGLETYYDKILQEEVPKYVKGDIDKFIGDASFPKKKNAHSLMEEAIRGGESSKDISKKFGWLRVRDGFSEPMACEDIDNIRKKLEPKVKEEKVKIPKELAELIKQVQELLFFRTERTDILHHLIYLARPILREVASHYKITFEELKQFPIQNLLVGDLTPYTVNSAIAVYEGETFFSKSPIINEKEVGEVNEVKGNIAFKGIIQGEVKIVKFVSELSKVKIGDILVTQMTFPSYIQAMIRAAAFVTDEGGITCHAAIVAREMKKPCVIGTKIATKVFKDGDMVEVDAVNGVVKKV